MTQNIQVCTIVLPIEVVYDIISGRDVRTMEGYLVINFEVASSNCFRDIPKNHFVTAADAAKAAADTDDRIK